MQFKKIACGLCHFEFTHGAHVCQGCTGNIIYGETQRERSEAAKIGAFIFGAGGLLFIYGLPIFLNIQFGTKIASAWGMGIIGLGISAGAAIVGAFVFTSSLRKRKRQEIRTFKR